MTFAEIIAAAVPEKQEAVRQELAKIEGAVKINSREEAAKFIDENSFMAAEFQSRLSKKNLEFETRFKAEDMPKLVEEEIKKRGPKPKDPEVLAAYEKAEKAEKAMQEFQDKAIKAEQRSVAVNLLSGIGLSAKMADLFIGKNDAETQANFAKYFDPKDPESFPSWRDGHAEKLLKDRFGTQPTPSGGGVPAPANARLEELRKQYAELARSGQMDAASAVTSEIMKLQKQAVMP